MSKAAKSKGDVERGLHDEETLAISDAVRLYTVGIVGGSDIRKWQGIGTGTLVRWAGHFLILTAAHVLKLTEAADLRFFLPSLTPPETRDRADIRSMHGVDTRDLFGFSSLALHRIAKNAALDLAAIETDEQLDGAHPTARFFRLSTGGTSPDVGREIVSMGFPRDLSRLTSGGNARVVFTYTHWTEVAENQSGLQYFDPDSSFLAPFREPDMAAKPEGMSGSAAWVLRDVPPQSIWRPDLELGGVTTSHYEQSRLIAFVRREAVEGFLATHFGNDG